MKQRKKNAGRRKAYMHDDDVLSDLTGTVSDPEDIRYSLIFFSINFCLGSLSFFVLP